MAWLSERVRYFGLFLVLLLVVGAMQLGCSEAGKVCKTNADCEAGKEVCRLEQCTAIADARACKSDSDCSEGQVCYQESCSPKVCTLGEIGPCEKDKKFVGACKDGLRVCIKNGSAWSGRCLGAVVARKEECDGLDNDCNGKVDDGVDCTCKRKEHRPCGIGSSGSNLVLGHCKAGIQYCEKKADGWTWGACQHQVTPQELIPQGVACLIKDLNCDGSRDDENVRFDEKIPSCICKHTDQPRPCFRFSKELDIPCNKGTQYCLKEGADKPGTDPKNPDNRCKEGENCQWTACQPNTDKIEVEYCDGKDNDCDGKVDNMPGSDEPLWEPCGAHADGCSKRCQEIAPGEKGMSFCLKADGKTACCKIELPQEICDNGVDDNCDGTVDEKNGCCKKGDPGC